MSETTWKATIWNGWHFERLQGPDGTLYRPQRLEPNLETVASILNAQAREVTALRDEAVGLLAVLDAEGFDGNRSAVNYHRERLRAALQAGETEGAG